MDEEKLSTDDLIKQQIWNRPKPKTAIPEDRERVSLCFNYYDKDEEEPPEDEVTIENAKAAVLRGNTVVSCSEYYGIPFIWQEGDKFRGQLLQYMNVTEDNTWDTVEEAALWFVNIAERCAG